MNDQSHMINRNFGIWRRPPLPPEKALGFQNSFSTFGGPAMPGGRIGNWSGRKSANKRKQQVAPSAAAGISGYNLPTLKELQSQNRAKARRFYPNKKKHTRFAPFAPRNTTSFIIRSKKSGGIASLVSPCPVTPAILPTPKFSPSREGLVDMAKEEWGVDGYGSMKGLIRLRSHARADDVAEDDVDDSVSSESDVEEHLEVERRLDHDLSRFEMVYPSHGEDSYLLENRVDDQHTHITRLEDENLTLKERLFIMEQEMAELQRRVQLLEDCHNGRHSNNKNNNNEDNMNNDNENNNSVVNSGNGEVGEEGSENDAASGGNVCSEIGDCEDGSDGDGGCGATGGEVTPMCE